MELARGKTVPEACKQIGVTEQTYYRWRKEYGGLRMDQAKRLKELEKENARLKRLRGGRGAGQGDPEGGRLGKLLSPAKRRQAVEHVRRCSRTRPGVGASGLPGAGSAAQHAAAAAACSRATSRGWSSGWSSWPRSTAATAIAGSRRCCVREGWTVNHKRVERLWRQEGLKVPQKQPKRGRLWLNDGSCVRLRPSYRGPRLELRLRRRSHAATAGRFGC